MNTTYRNLAIAAIVVLLGFAIWRGTRHAAGPTASVSPSASPIVSATPLTIPYNGSTSGWLTYASASAGFTALYPPDWTAIACGPGCIAWSPKDHIDQPVMGLSLMSGKLADILAQAKQYEVGSEITKIGLNTWTHLTLQSPETGMVVTSHLIQHGTNMVFEFGTDATDAATIARYGALINSLKFTK